jgi:hypothetical protein
MRVHRAYSGSAVLVAALLIAPLAGCADRAGPGGPAGPAAPPPSSAPVEQTDPVALVGFWTVTPTGPPVEGGVVVRLGDQDLRVFLGCGQMLGSWRADPTGLFVAEVDGTSGCMAADPVKPRWLSGAAAFRVDGEERVLLDAQDRTVARLSPGGRPPAGVEVAPDDLKPPRVTDETRRAFAPAAALPAGLRPATDETLIGRWLPADGTPDSPTPPFVEFVRGGQWRGSDGCNGQGGRWAAGEAGALLATSGPSTLIGCDNVPVSAWLSPARRAGFDGAELVLLDAAGKELGRLARN